MVHLQKPFEFFKRLPFAELFTNHVEQCDLDSSETRVGSGDAVRGHTLHSARSDDDRDSLLLQTTTADDRQQHRTAQLHCGC